MGVGHSSGRFISRQCVQILRDTTNKAGVKKNWIFAQPLKKRAHAPQVDFIIPEFRVNVSQNGAVGTNGGFPRSFKVPVFPSQLEWKQLLLRRRNLPKCSAARKSSGYRTFTFLQDLHRVSNFEWEAMLDGPSETGQH